MQTPSARLTTAASQRLEPGQEPTPIDMGPVQDWIGVVVRMVQYQLFEAFYERFGEYGLTPAEFAALTVVQRNPGIRQGVLAAALLIKRANMTKLVRRLVQAGLLTRQVPADDKRAYALYLTPFGEQRVADALAQADEHEAASTHMLTARERAQLMKLLRKMLAAGNANGDRKER